MSKLRVSRERAAPRSRILARPASLAKQESLLAG